MSRLLRKSSKLLNNAHSVLENDNLLTVNWHIVKECNYKCKFCFAHYEDAEFGENLNSTDCFKLLSIIKNNNIYKINFAGGEPLLNMNLGEYLKYAKHIGLKTSIITNASRLTVNWLHEYGAYIDQIGISCDSLSNIINTNIGRGYGNHFDLTSRAIDRINELNKNENLNINIKLNTVVFRYNFMENWIDFIKEHSINRWKVFKILKIKNENDDIYDDISITDDQFNDFVNRHLILNENEKIMFAENNNDMICSYIMISPDGRFYQNTGNIHNYSHPILDVGFQTALEQIGFNYDKFKARGGQYLLHQN